ncbi:MAG: MFS transporter, partial [Deltaproteobacteria bacterium]|nr:MFS transporter [Deltaproteobacteria bacterium]
VMTMGFGVGSAFGAYIGGYFYDLTGSYLIPFMLVLGSIVVAALGIWMAAPRRLRVV